VSGRRRTALRVVGVTLLALAGIAIGIAAIVGIGLLFWLAIKGLVVVVWRAIVDSIKDSISGRS
jgi:hypothetical protein